MPRNAQVLAPSDHTLLLSTLRTCLEIVRDVALVVTTVYVIHLEVTATTSDNYESTRRLGLSSTDECSVARRLYDCQTNVVLSTDVPVVGNLPHAKQVEQGLDREENRPNEVTDDPVDEIGEVVSHNK